MSTLTSKQISDRMKQNLQQTDDDVMTRFTLDDMGTQEEDITTVAGWKDYDPNKTNLDLNNTGEPVTDGIKSNIRNLRNLLEQDDSAPMLDEKSRKFR